MSEVIITDLVMPSVWMLRTQPSSTRNDREDGDGRAERRGSGRS